MARGDGKVQRGHTRGRNVVKMAVGGLAASSREGGFAAAGPSRLESPGQRSSVSPGAGNISAGRIAGGDMRIGDGRTPNALSRTERTAAMTSPDAMRARLGPNAAQAMVDAGVSPDIAGDAARSINRRATDTRSVLGDPNPGQRLATANRDGSFSYSPIQRSTVVKNQRKQIYDRILPDSEPATNTSLANATGATGFGTVPSPSSTASLANVRADALRTLADARRRSGVYPTRPISIAEVPKMEGTPIDTGWNPATGTFEADSTPTRSVNVGQTPYGSQTPRAEASTQGGQTTSSPAAPAASSPTATPSSSKPRNVVAGRSNFTAGSTPGGRGGGGGNERRRDRKKKPIIEETAVTNVRHGGTIRGDGKANSGRTKGRYI